MTLKDLFEYLTYGELAQLDIGGLVPDAAESGPDPKDYAKLMSHVNMGLKEVYKRFWLRSEEVIIQLYDHIATYTLDKKYAITNKMSVEPYKYIIDSPIEPFTNNVLKIEQVFDEGGRQMFLNDRTEPWSVFTPAYNQVQIPFPERHNSMVIQYRAAHPTIKYEFGMDPEKIELQIPEGLLEPLLFYIASRAFAGLNTDMNQEGNNYLQKFEASCKKAEELGLQVTTNLSNLRLDQRGWV